MHYRIVDRIGPMEGGARDGEYLEAGEVVSADAFRAESIPVLLEVGVIAELASGEISSSGEGVSAGTETTTIWTEVNDGTHDSDSA